jgi:hypothetical protein
VQVIGLDSFSTLDHSEMNSVVSGHVEGLRTWKNGFLRESLIVVFMESNFDAIMAQQVASMLHGIPFFRPIHCRYDVVKRNGANERRYGVITNAMKKHSYVIQTREVLMEDRLFFAGSGVSVKSGWVCTKDKLLRQMAAYRATVKPPADEAFGVYKRTFTGKGGNRKDDLAMAFQINLYHMRESMMDSEFMKRIAGPHLRARPTRV